MGDVASVTVEGITYNYVQCNAKTQRSIMFRLAKYGLAGVLEHAIENEDMGGAFISGLFTNMPEGEFNEICDSLLYKCFVQGETSPVTIDDFTGKMPDYMRLVVELLKGNFSDFSGLLGS